MALNKNFKVKDTINVGVSGLFGSGIVIGTKNQYQFDDSGVDKYYTPIAIDAWGPILSGGRDLSTFIGAGLDDIREGTVDQGTIEFSTLTDTNSESDYTSNTVEVKGLQITDAPTFTDLNLTGATSSNVSRIVGAKTLILDPVDQAYASGSITFTPVGESTEITVTILAKNSGTAGNITAAAFNNAVDGNRTIGEVIEEAGGTAANYYLTITGGTPDAGVTADNAVPASGETLNGTGGISGGANAESADGVLGTVVIKGDLQVDGSTTTVNSSELKVTDSTITIAKDATDATVWTGAAILVGDGTQNITLTDDGAGGTGSYWTITDDIVVGDGANTARVQGSGNFDLSLKTGHASTGEIKIAGGAANGDISLLPNGTGLVVVGGTAPTVTTDATDKDLLLKTGSTTSGSITVGSAANGNLLIAPHGTGDVVVGSGTAGAEIVSSGANNLTLHTGANDTSSLVLVQGTNGGATLEAHGTGVIQLKSTDVKVGSSAAAGTITSNGDHDLVLKTGNTTTGSITLTDGANGDITLAPNGTGKVAITAAESTQTSGEASSTQGVFSTTVATDGTATLATVADSNDAIEAEIVIRKGSAVQMIKLLAVNDGAAVDGTQFGEVTVGTITLGDYLDVTLSDNKYVFSLGTGTGTLATGSTDVGGVSQEDCDLTVTIRAITA